VNAVHNVEWTRLIYRLPDPRRQRASCRRSSRRTDKYRTVIQMFWFRVLAAQGRDAMTASVNLKHAGMSMMRICAVHSFHMADDHGGRDRDAPHFSVAID
jgi:hypothetical protein